MHAVEVRQAAESREGDRTAFALRCRAAARPTLLALLLVAGWLYARTLDYGFIWDDPHWFGRVAGQSWLDVIRPAADFHFYRPGTMLYIRLFLQADGTFAAPALHWLQGCWHLLNVALAYALARRLRLGRGAAAAVALLVALYPFSYQAIAWAAPQQPLAAALQQGAWLGYLVARAGGGRRRAALALSVLLFGAALTVQEVTLPMAALPLLFELVLRRRLPRGWREWRRPLLYPLLAALYGLLWLQAPRQPGITGFHFDGQVALYLLQGFVYPLLGRPAGYPPGEAMSAATLLSLALLGLAVCLALALWQRRGAVAMVGLAWAVLGVSPVVVGLPYDYVELAPRLLYYAAPGVALLWVSAWWPSRQAVRWWPSLAGAGLAVLALVAVQSALLLAAEARLYSAGAAHLGELLAAIGEEDGRYLFVNFPDRYALKRRPFPLGYWGVTLAPVSVELSSFATVLRGGTPETDSRSLPWVDGDAREAGPYQIDLRGVITPIDELYGIAPRYDAIYLSRSRPDGSFSLQRAGALAPGQAGAGRCRLALFAESACLWDLQLTPEGEHYRLRTVWSTYSLLAPHETIFAHIGLPAEPPLAQADGDTWQGALPLAYWQPGDLIIDERLLPRPPAQQPLFLILGVYDWVTGIRLAATDAQGRPLPRYGYLLSLEALGQP